MRLAIIKLVIELISLPPRRAIIAGFWIRSKSVNLGPTGRKARAWARGRGREAG